MTLELFKEKKGVWELAVFVAGYYYTRCFTIKLWSSNMKLIFKGRSIKKLFASISLMLLVTFSLSLGIANEADDIVLREVKINGNFTNSLSLPEIESKIFTTDDVSEKKLGLFISNKEVYKSEVRTEIKYIGKCYDRETKLDQLIYFEWNGGASDVGKIVFFHYIHSKNLFKPENFINRNESFVSNYKQKKSTGLVVFKENKAICNWKEKRSKRAEAKSIFHAIRPTKKPTLVTNDYDTLKIKSISPQLIVKLKANDEIKTETIFNNQKWKVENIESKSYEYLKKGWNSWGVLIAEEKGTNNIFSFYNTSPGDSHKVILYTTEILECNAQKQGDSKICLSLCTECSWWGQYGSFLIDLEKRNIKRMKK